MDPHAEASRTRLAGCDLDNAVLPQHLPKNGKCIRSAADALDDLSEVYVNTVANCY